MITEIPVQTIDGRGTTLEDYDGVRLVVNVASRCGLTPQYAGLERLQETYAARGFTVLGFPCNQFGGQEPGSNAEIQTFCSTTYGTSFPMFDKVEVNGPDRHPLYAELTSAVDPDGSAGDMQWNFEKFLVGRDGAVLARFRSRTEPEDPTVLAVIETALTAS